jgi:peroxiredoxin 3
LFILGLFLIDPNGILRQITVNDLPVGRSVDETLRLVKAFQFVEKVKINFIQLYYIEI